MCALTPPPRGFQIMSIVYINPAPGWPKANNWTIPHFTGVPRRNTPYLGRSPGGANVHNGPDFGDPIGVSSGTGCFYMVHRGWTCIPKPVISVVLVIMPFHQFINVFIHYNSVWRAVCRFPRRLAVPASLLNPTMVLCIHKYFISAQGGVCLGGVYPGGCLSKWMLGYTPQTCGHSSWHKLVKTLPSRNYCCGL